MVICQRVGGNLKSEKIPSPNGAWAAERVPSFSLRTELSPFGLSPSFHWPSAAFGQEPF